MGDKERVRDIVRREVLDRTACVAGWDGFSPGSIERMASDIANRVADQLALGDDTISVPLFADDFDLIDRALYTLLNAEYLVGTGTGDQIAELRDRLKRARLLP